MDRNPNAIVHIGMIAWSLSARRAWIEISTCPGSWILAPVSLSARRAWIEIENPPHEYFVAMSLSARRAWIEIIGLTCDGLIASGRSPQGERG